MAHWNENDQRLKSARTLGFARREVFRIQSETRTNSRSGQKGRDRTSPGLSSEELQPKCVQLSYLPEETKLLVYVGKNRTQEIDVEVCRILT